MRRYTFRALGAVLLAVAACCTTLGPADRGYSRPAEYQASKTVKIAQEAGGGNYYCGSAFLIHVTKDSRGTYTGLFLTAGHVVNLKSQTTVLFQQRGDPKKKYYARVDLKTVITHPRWDAAVFQVPGLPAFLALPLPLAKNLPTMGQWVLSAGYANCGPLAWYPGAIQGSGVLPVFGPCFASNARIIGGMSGGPVLNTAGEVLGHTVARGGKREHFFVPVHVLKAWLKTVR